MKIIVVKNYDEMSREAARVMAEVIKNKPNCTLGMATGSTPEGLYDCLTALYEQGELDFSGVSTVSLDEYYPISPENHQSYRYFMDKHLFDRVNINKANTFIPDGEAEDVAAACAAHDKKIEELGIDIQILGIGRNGHIGFNEPDTELIRGTHLTALTPDTIKANSRFFASEADVPTHALTMGVANVFSAKKLLLMASGKNKAEAVAKVINGGISTSCPASLLCLHPDLVVICDEDAYSLV